MKYKNANDILPQRLLDELQHYVCGEIIYIPKPAEKHKKWGEVSGGRKYIMERNNKIRSIFEKQRSIEKLADEFSLSTDSIKKIVYSK